MTTQFEYFNHPLVRNVSPELAPQYEELIFSDIEKNGEAIYSLAHFLDTAACDRLEDFMGEEMYDGILDAIPEGQLNLRTGLSGQDILNARIRRHVTKMKLDEIAEDINRTLTEIGSGVVPEWETTALYYIYPDRGSELPLVRTLQDTQKIARRLAAKYCNGEWYPARSTAEEMVLYSAYLMGTNEVAPIMEESCFEVTEYLLSDLDFLWYYENNEEDYYNETEEVFNYVPGEDYWSDTVEKQDADGPSTWFNHTRH